MTNNLQTIPVKFTLMGVSKDVNNDILDFRDAIMKEFKSMLTLISIDIEGMKFTDVKERFSDDINGSLRGLTAAERMAINFAYIEGNDQETETFHLYYDIIAVLSNTNVVPGPTVIKAVRQNHLEILQQLHEYKSEYYYYVDDFDLCTTSEEEEKAASEDIDDRKFSLCTYDHQLVGITFAALGMPSDMDRGIFSEALMDTYEQMLHDVDGLVITGIYPVKQEQEGNETQFYFDVNALQKDNRNMKPVIAKKIQSADGMNQVLNRVQKYTDDEGRDLQWCITDDEQYSTGPCVAVQSKWYDMPTWKIVTITSISVILVCGICFSIHSILRQRAKESKQCKSKIRDCHRGRHLRGRRKNNWRHHSNVRYSRPHTRREERQCHRRHRQPYRKSTRHRRQYTGETLSDIENNEPPRCLVLEVPSQNQHQREKLRVEPWQQLKLPKNWQQEAVEIDECHMQRSNFVHATQRSQSPTKQQCELQNEQGHVYCDEDIVNRQHTLKTEKSLQK